MIASERSDGDLHPRRVCATVGGTRVRMVEQVHGIDAMTVDDPGAPWPLAGRADVIVATDSGAIGVWAADCAPVMLIGECGSLVGAHAGWRGLADGVLDVAAAQMAELGERTVSAVLGPVIHPCCYEFGAEDLVEVAAGVHAAPADVAASTSDSRGALDVPAAVRAGLAAHGIELHSVGPCTGCDERFYSHRVRSEPERHALIAISEPAA